MSLRGATGELLFRTLKVKIFTPHNLKARSFILRAEGNKAFTREGIDAQLDHIAQQIEEQYPEHEYRLIPIGGGIFNFVWQAEKATT